jgi:hypothetical protein
MEYAQQRVRIAGLQVRKRKVFGEEFHKILPIIVHINTPNVLVDLVCLEPQTCEGLRLSREGGLVARFRHDGMS